MTTSLAISVSYDELDACLRINERYIQPLRQLLIALQHPALWVKLIENYEQSAERFHDSLTQYFDEQVASYALEEKLKARAAFSWGQLQQVADKATFDQQQIPIGLDGFTWSSRYWCSHTGFKSNGQSYDRWHDPITYNQSHLLERGKNHHIKHATEQLQASLKSYDGSLFIHPIDPMRHAILLPMPTQMIDAIPNQVHYLCSKAGGTIYFYYRYDDATKCLGIEGHIMLPEGKFCTFFDKTIRHELPYTGVEAIWWLWMGGKMPATNKMQEINATTWQSDGYARFNTYYSVPCPSEIQGAFHTSIFQDPSNLVPLSSEILVIYEKTLRDNLARSELYHQALRLQVEDFGHELGRAYEAMNRDALLIYRTLECLEQLSASSWISKVSCSLQDIRSAESILEHARAYHQHAKAFFPKKEEISAVLEAILLNLERRAEDTTLFFEQRLDSFNTLIQQLIPYASLGMSTPEKAALDEQAFALLEAVMHQVSRGEVQTSSENLANAVLQGLSILRTAREEGRRDMLTHLSQALLLSESPSTVRASQVRGTLFEPRQALEGASIQSSRGLNYSGSVE